MKIGRGTVQRAMVFLAAVSTPVMFGRGARAQGAMTAAQLMPTLHAFNQVEIEAGRTAEERGASDAVKQYGATLVRDHEAADKNLKHLAAEEKVALDENVPPVAQFALRDAKGELTNLSTVGGQAFDREFATTMLQQHQLALRLVDQARSNISDPKLKALLGEVAPDLREHAQIASNILSGFAAAPRRSGDR